MKDLYLSFILHCSSFINLREQVFDVGFDEVAEGLEGGFEGGGFGG